MSRGAVLVVAASAVLATAIAAGCASAPAAEARPVVAAANVQGGDWFTQTGCTKCHSVSVHGIYNLASTAPDLSLAVEDVPRRFGRSLDEFFHQPSGTMAMVLSTAIPMTAEQRGVAISKLKEAYRLHQEATGAGRPVASH